MNIPMGLVWPNYYGRRHLGSIQSVNMTAIVLGSAIGPIAFGWAYDQYGSYDLRIVASIIIWAVGAALAFLAPPPVKRS